MYVGSMAVGYSPGTRDALLQLVSVSFSSSSFPLLLLLLLLLLGFRLVEFFVVVRVAGFFRFVRWISFIWLDRVVFRVILWTNKVLHFLFLLLVHHPFPHLSPPPLHLHHNRLLVCLLVLGKLR